jgi:peptidoglycan/LPS O-acetylase OafA/YrhL
VEDSTRSGFVPALEGVRGVAIALVVLVHAYALPSGGFLGVDVFFVLSGFLITMLLLREQNAKGRFSLRGFYRRRALRLLPALAVFLAAHVVLLSVVLPGPIRGWHYGSAKPVLESSLFLSNIVQATQSTIGEGLGQLWSLATEEQFYLLLPLVLLALVRATPRTLARVFAISFVAIAANGFLMEAEGANRIRLYFNPIARFDTLLAGCLFAVWYVHGNAPRLLRSPTFRRRAWPLVLAAAAIPVYTTRNWADPSLFRFVLPLFSPAVGFLIFVAATDARSLLARVLALWPLRYLGRISYSLYLWHPFVFWFAAAAAAHYGGSALSPVEGIAVSVAVAILSTRFVERPFLRLKSSGHALRQQQVVGGEVLVGVEACARRVDVEPTEQNGDRLPQRQVARGPGMRPGEVTGEEPLGRPLAEPA